jgi:hypothetical protein
MRRWLCAFLPRALTLFVLAFVLPVTTHADERSALGPSILRVPSLERKVEQGILTPVPLELELPADLPARRVLAHYRIHGSKAWITLELLRYGKRWIGAIPCLEVSTITGDISYYIRIHDAAGAVIAYSGSRHRPYRVTIRHDTTRPRTDGGAERNRCPDPADCPPGLLGCPSAEVERVPCRSDDDCEGELSCDWDGFCAQDLRSYDWFGLELDGGLGVVSATGACSVPNQENEGYACYRADSELYTGRPVYTNEPLAVGTTPVRIVLAYERLLSEHALLGARFGYALLGEGRTPRGGSRFVPYSAELRAVHVFGHDPFASTGIKPYALVGAGYAMHDIQVDVRVRHDLRQAVDQGGNDLEQTLEVWRRAGDAFIGLGSGLLWITSPGSALSVELRGTQSFPFNAFVLGGSIGARVGL